MTFIIIFNVIIIKTDLFDYNWVGVFCDNLTPLLSAKAKTKGQWVLTLCIHDCECPAVYLDTWPVPETSPPTIHDRFVTWRNNKY